MSLYSLILDTFGVQSVSITDTTGNRVCLQCVFSSKISIDSGCTVELVNSSTTIVHYSTVFNRSTNIAEGCITDVTSGQYDIRVYIMGSLLNYWIRNVSVSTNSHSDSNGGLQTVSGTALASPKNGSMLHKML